MPTLQSKDFPSFYQDFNQPVAEFDCGQRCAPYNQRGVPFCCDTHHAVPTAYQPEWDYLKANTDLWHVWMADKAEETIRLQAQTPPGLVLIECQGHTRCQRAFRSMTCRAFPFFPYINKEGDFLGLSYYWEYEDRCWVISHLGRVTPAFRDEFIAAYTRLFSLQPSEFELFYQFSTRMRQIFGRRRRSIPLLHRNGKNYKITPRNGRMRSVPAGQFLMFGPYKIASKLPFPDEVS